MIEGDDPTGGPLGGRMAAHLQQLAADCDSVQRAVGDLIRVAGSGTAGGAPRDLPAQTLRDLQGLDRIVQALHDLARVQQALAAAEAAALAEAEARALGAARLEETRKALTGEKADAPRTRDADSCQLF